MKICSKPKILCVYDPSFGSVNYPYAFACAPLAIKKVTDDVQYLDIKEITVELFQAAIEKNNPDIVFCFLQNLVDQKKMSSILDIYHPKPIINWSLEDPNGVVTGGQSYTMLDASENFDAWFCNDSKMVPFWKTRARFMPPGFDDDVFYDKNIDRIYDVSYIGNIGPKATAEMYWPYFEEMSKYRQKALMCTERPLGIPLLPGPIEKILRSRRNKDFFQGLNIWRNVWRNPRNEDEKSFFINQSKIHVGLNRVRGRWESSLLSLIPEYPLDKHNMFYQLKGRLFHAVGTGALALNEYCPELEDMFDINSEIAVFEYGDVEGFREKLQWYSNNDGARQKVALAGRLRGLKQHTWHQRINQIIDYIRNEL